MDKKYIENSLISIGYSAHMIKSILERKPKEDKPPVRPSIENMYKLKDQYGIPLEAWRDIKSFISTSSQKTAN